MSSWGVAPGADRSGPLAWGAGRRTPDPDPGAGAGAGLGPPPRYFAVRTVMLPSPVWAEIRWELAGSRGTDTCTEPSPLSAATR